MLAQQKRNQHLTSTGHESISLKLVHVLLTHLFQSSDDEIRRVDKSIHAVRQTRFRLSVELRAELVGQAYVPT